MKKFWLIIFALISIVCKSQSPNVVEKTAWIALGEANAYQRLTGQEEFGGVSDNFDVKYYRCEWEVDPAVRYIKGKVTTYFTLVSTGNSIIFDMMSPLVVDSIKQRSQTLSFTHANNLITITLGSTLSAGTLDSVSVYYHGVPANTGFGSFINSSHAGVPVVWSLSEPYGSRDWWPCKNNLGDKADSIDVFVTHANTYKAASNGLLQSESALPGGKTLTWWKHRYPIASYLICFSVTNFSVFNNSVQLGSTNLPMQTHCYPENLADFQNNTQKVLDAIQLFHNTYGDYPFLKEKYGHVQFGWGGGMEHQTSTFLVTPDESLMAHELAHQWYGDKVTCANWGDIWLNEGFATFLARHYMENKYPANAVANRKAVVANITSVIDGSVKVPDTTNVNRIFSGRLSYNKGSFVLQMLKLKLGDEKFYAGMKQYHNKQGLAYGYVAQNDFKTVMEQVSGQDLTQFFQQWYEKEGYPTYNVEWSQFGSTSVKIKMSQTTSMPASVSFFAMPVPLLFKNATQQKTLIVDNTSNGQMFTKYIGFVPDTVLVDPEWLMIHKNDITKKIAYTPTGAGMVTVYPNPVLGPVTVILEDFAANNVDIAVFNTAGQVMYKKSVALVNGSEIIQLPTATWSSGVYMMHIIANDKKIIRKLLK